MRKEISIYFKEKKFGRKIILGIFFLLTFIIINGVFIYMFNFNNYYFSVIKRIIPYPAFIFSGRLVTVGDYEKELSLNRKIYESAYRVDFSSKEGGAENLKALRKNVKEGILNRLIMEEYLKKINQRVTRKDVQKEYDKITRDIGGDKEIREILRYTSNIGVSDIKNKIYLNIVKERIREHIIYGLKIKIILIKPNDTSSKESWDDTKNEAGLVIRDMRENPEKINDYILRYNDDSDNIIKNLNGNYVSAEDLPSSFKDVFYELDVGSVSEPLKTESGYYIIVAEEKRGYYRGSLEEFLAEERGKLKIWSFID